MRKRKRRFFRGPRIGYTGGDKVFGSDFGSRSSSFYDTGLSDISREAMIVCVIGFVVMIVALLFLGLGLGLSFAYAPEGHDFSGPDALRILSGITIWVGVIGFPVGVCICVAVTICAVADDAGRILANRK